MPKQGQRAEVNTFVQGLVTEASPLNFPDNASVDEENFELNRDGTRHRRLGIDFEAGDTKRTLSAGYSFPSSKFNTFVWKSVGGDQNLDALVVQAGNSLYFFDLSYEDITTSGYMGTIQLSSFYANKVFSLASVDGRLIVVCGAEFVNTITYDGTSFTAAAGKLKVRDLWGVEETDATTEADILYNPTTLTITHKYNLYNQSWGIPRKDKAGTLSNASGLYNTALAKYPSNSETVWPGLQFQPVQGTTDPFERVYPNLYEDARGADIIAPKGYFVIDVMKRGASRVSAFNSNNTKHTANGDTALVAADLPRDETVGGPTSVAEFAGRVFYAGFGGQLIGGDSRSPDLSSFILFSSLVINNDDILKCYQAGDPTSRDNTDLVDTDGGFIRISGAKNIIALRQLESNLIVIASNGVWAVTGGADYGFSASNYKVTKLSSFGGLSESSVVVEGGRLYYWAEDGIYSVQKDQFGDLGVTSISIATIQRMYDVIPVDSKSNCFGAYDQYGKKVRWIYKTGDLFSINSVTYELILDLVLGAFYKNKISASPSGNTIEVISPFQSVLYEVGDFHLQSLKYLTIVKNTAADGTVSYSYSLSHYRNDNFADWKTVDNVGVDAKAFMTSGMNVAGDSAIEKQTPYLVMHFRRTEGGVSTDSTPLYPSSCLVRSMWNWSGSENSNKWSKLFQAYRYRLPYFISGTDTVYDTGFDVVTTKSKIRGRGKSFAFHMETEPGKDCRILGWNLTINGNAL